MAGTRRRHAGIARARLTTAAVLVGYAAVTGPAEAAVLPEDRADLMYHYYDGGGTKVEGPALLARKSIADKASVYAKYYQDDISSASIDVVTTASKFKEKRDEHTFGLDFLSRNTMFGLSVTNSEEPDYVSDTVTFNVSHELSGGLTTVNLGYSRGEDEVGKVDTQFRDTVDRNQYRLGISQVLTKGMVVSLEHEGIDEDGFLNSPYRAARLQGLLVPERYPRTRSSNAFSTRLITGFESERGGLSSSLQLRHRRFQDTWDIEADEVEVGYQRYFGRRLIVEGHVRYYSQDAASFYSDNFQTAQVFMARDKELSSFTSLTVGFKGSYELFRYTGGRTRGAVSLGYDRIRFDYDDFTDTRTGKLYTFDADVVQGFLSIWY